MVLCTSYSAGYSPQDAWEALSVLVWLASELIDPSGLGTWEGQPVGCQRVLSCTGALCSAVSTEPAALKEWVFETTAQAGPRREPLGSWGLSTGCRHSACCFMTALVPDLTLAGILCAIRQVALFLFY